MQWSSSNPYVLSVDAPSKARQSAKAAEDTTGPQVSGLQIGVTYLTASMGAITTQDKVVVLGYPRFVYIANMLRDSVSA